MVVLLITKLQKCAKIIIFNAFTLKKLLLLFFATNLKTHLHCQKHKKRMFFGVIFLSKYSKSITYMHARNLAGSYYFLYLIIFFRLLLSVINKHTLTSQLMFREYYSLRSRKNELCFVKKDKIN